MKSQGAWMHYSKSTMNNKFPLQEFPTCRKHLSALAYNFTRCSAYVAYVERKRAEWFKLSLRRDPGGEYQLKLGEVPEIRLTVSVTNRGEDAHETTLWVQLPDNINMLGVESKVVYLNINTR